MLNRTESLDLKWELSKNSTFEFFILINELECETELNRLSLNSNSSFPLGKCTQSLIGWLKTNTYTTHTKASICIRKYCWCESFFMCTCWKQSPVYKVTAAITKVGRKYWFLTISLMHMHSVRTSDFWFTILMTSHAFDMHFTSHIHTSTWGTFTAFKILIPFKITTRTQTEYSSAHHTLLSLSSSLLLLFIK